VPIAVNPLLLCDIQHAQQEGCSNGRAVSAEQQPQLDSQTQQEGVATAAMEDSFWRQLAAGDEAFLAGRWQESEAAYTEALPLAAGHLVSVSSSDHSTVRCLYAALEQQLLRRIPNNLGA
jgi:hypothetical protein